jgi:glycosyltransferase involved in cell wall biosynthesis
MKRIRVLEMIDQPFLGGGQINLLSLAKNLDRAKFEVFISSGEGGPLVEEAKKNRIKHFPLRFSKRIKVKIFSEMASLLEREKIDILHTHGGVAGFYGRWAAHKSRTPVVIHTLHGIHYLHYRNILLKRTFILLERIFSSFTDAVILVSEADRNRALAFKLAPFSKINVINNGIDFLKDTELNNPEEKRKELGIGISHPLVGTVARLHRQKGLIYLIKAAKKIHQAVPEVMILIVGGGPLRRKLEKTAIKEGLGNFIVLTGEREDAAELLSIFDVFVLPSLWEGLPYVLMEASSLGKPIVATDVEGVNEIIEDGKTGMLVPPRNSKNLAEAVIRLLDEKNFASKLGESAKKLIPPRYRLSKMVEDTQNLYLKLFQIKTGRSVL